MKKGVLNYLNNYLNKLEEAENADIFEIGPERYEDNIQDLIIEIGTVFIKELPEIRESVILRSDTLSRDLNMTKGIIKKYLIENGFKEINKNDQNIEKFWTSFITYFENELPTKGYLKEEYIQYDNGAYAGIGFYCKKDLVSINTMELTYIIYDLNILMDKIQDLVYKTEEEHKEELDIFTKEEITIIKNRKNIEYNSTYVRIPRWIDIN